VKPKGTFEQFWGLGEIMAWVTRYHNRDTDTEHDMRLWIENWDDIDKFETWLVKRNCKLIDMFEID